jgi:hypothetical protein
MHTRHARRRRSVPATARGKVLTVRVAIAFDGRAVTKLTAFHVA